MLNEQKFTFAGQCGYNVEKVLSVLKSEFAFFVDFDASEQRSSFIVI